jgi:hypothetical protein
MATMALLDGIITNLGHTWVVSQGRIVKIKSNRGTIEVVLGQKVRLGVDRGAEKGTEGIISHIVPPVPLDEDSYGDHVLLVKTPNDGKNGRGHRFKILDVEPLDSLMEKRDRRTGQSSWAGEDRRQRTES